MTGITSMGTTLLIGSCEPFSGKSALVLGIAQQLARSGQQIRFGKPLATSLDWDCLLYTSDAADEV